MLLPPSMWNDAIWPDPRVTGRTQTLLFAHWLRLPHFWPPVRTCPDSYILEWRQLLYEAEGRMEEYTDQKNIFPLFGLQYSQGDLVMVQDEDSRDCSLSVSVQETAFSFSTVSACTRVFALSFVSSWVWIVLWTTYSPPTIFSAAMTGKRIVNI